MSLGNRSIGDVFGTRCASLGLLMLVALQSACGQPGPDTTEKVRVVLSSSGPAPIEGGRYGTVVAGVGDVDGDRVRDLAVTSANAVNFADGAYQGQVMVVSGATGALLFTLEDPDPQMQEPDLLFGHALLSVDDLDGDGIDEIAVGARRYDGLAVDQGRTYIFRGADGALLRAIDGPADAKFFGGNLVQGDDVDGDGVRELLVTASPSGRAYLVSPQDGSILVVYQIPSPSDQSDYQVHSCSWLNDIDGDGGGDAALGGTIYNDSGPTGTGNVHLFSGTGALLWTLESPTGDDSNFGNGLTGLSDVDNDGIEDIAVASFDRDVVVTSSRELAAPLYALKSQCPSFGETLIRLPDLDCDRVPELAVAGRDCKIGGAVYVYSGASGEELATVAPRALTVGALLGTSLSLLQEHPDGSVDLAIGAPAQGNRVNAGAVYVVRLFKVFGACP